MHTYTPTLLVTEKNFTELGPEDREVGVFLTHTCSALFFLGADGILEYSTPSRGLGA